MKVTTEPREYRQVALTIEVEPERVEAALARASKRLAQKYKIPGFRPGKAPRSVIEQRFGKQALYDEAIDELGNQVYREALDQNDIDPYGPGEMEDVQLDPLVFKMLVPLAPKIDLGDYRNVRVPYEAPAVDEHDVEHQLEHIRENQAIIEPVAEDTPADSDMIATVDIESTVEGQPFINQKGAQINLYEPLDRDDEDVIEFSDQIIGMKTGEDKSFSRAVPDTDDYGEFRGKTAEFKVHVNELRRRELPDLDDALAQTVGDYETLEALKDALRAELLESATQAADSEYSDKVIDAIVEQATIEFPPPMVESELDAMLERTEKRMKDQKLTLEEYLKAVGKSREEYREELRPTAEIRLKRGLMLSQLIASEGLQVSDEEVNQRIQAMAGVYGPRADEARRALSGKDNRANIRTDLLSQAAVTRAVAIAKSEAPALDKPPAEAVAEAMPAETGELTPAEPVQDPPAE